MYVSSKLRLMEENGFRSLISDGIFESNEIILNFERNFVAVPDTVTLQIGENMHQLSRDKNAFENFVNHSCEPTAYIDFQNLSLKAFRKIEIGEVITYNYFTTDYHSKDIFNCNCRSKKCKKVINGFMNLSYQEMQALEPYLSPFLKQKMKELVYARV